MLVDWKVELGGADATHQLISKLKLCGLLVPW